MAHLNRDQVNQVRRLLRSLQRASDNIILLINGATGQDASLLVKYAQAKDALIRARLELENPDKNISDLKIKRLLLHADPMAAANVRDVLQSLFGKEPTLSEFGAVPWLQINEAFESGETRCPLAFRMFHAEYQKELHVSTNVLDLVSGLVDKKP